MAEISNNLYANAPPSSYQSVLEKYDITGVFAKNLNQLQGFKLVCICDDSTSMRETLAKGQTKWSELVKSVEIVLDIANAYNVDCDVLFLNRPGLRNVKQMSQLDEQFSTPPSGCTPLTRIFKLALDNNRIEVSERRLLVLIFTDGSPSSDKGSSKDPIDEFKDALKFRKPIDRIFITIVACTDDDYALDYLNNWDSTIKNLDIVDDYQSEKKEIYASGKVKNAFTFGDYIAKVMLGSFVKEIDQLDEKPCLCEIL
jgi:hypothetical protein